MTSWRALAAVPAALGLALLTTTPAQAVVGTSAGDVDTTRANVISLDALSVTNGVATLSFTYTCVGTQAGFLWVSVKQPSNPTDTAWNLETEGTSSRSKAWDSMHTAVPCSGTSKAVPMQATMAIDDEYGWFEDVPLSTGPTFVQLCLTMPAGKSFAAPGFQTQTGEGTTSSAAKAMGLALNYSWVNL